MPRRPPILLAILAVAIASSPSIGAAQERLSDADMRKLAMAGVRATAPGLIRMSSFELERWPASSYGGRYVAYEAMANPGNQFPAYSHAAFVIDPRTGDMWDGVTDCGEITSPEIRRLQRSYRRRLGLTAAAYTKIKRRGPMCEQQ